MYHEQLQSHLVSKSVKVTAILKDSFTVSACQASEPYIRMHTGHSQLKSQSHKVTVASMYCTYTSTVDLTILCKCTEA